MDPGTGKNDPGPPGGVRFREALRFWGRLGFISFGGPAGQIAIMHREIVERRGWISETRFLHALNYCMLLPGPEAQQLATYVGWVLHGARGGLAAGILFVLPSAVILLGLSWAYAAYGDLPLVAGVLSGFKCVVVAIVAEAVLRIGRRVVRGWPRLMVAAGAFVGIHFLRIPFPVIVLAAGLVGLGGSRLFPGSWGSRAARSRDSGQADPGRSDPQGWGAMKTLAAGLLLWLVPGAALAAWLGFESVPVQQYGFFTGAALVTFGGAYAVLAYVTQAAVHSYGWITPAQAVDGLALAETTPGPLIMVLQFVGFMAGWNHPGSLDPLAAAILCAVITTWTTFLPCFLFVLIGAPYVERLHGHRALTGALSGVTAAVIGVILNLALVFGATVLLPGGGPGSLDGFAVVLSVASFLALYSGRIDTLWIVLGGGGMGLARALIFE